RDKRFPVGSRTAPLMKKQNGFRGPRRWVVVAVDRPSVRGLESYLSSGGAIRASGASGSLLFFAAACHQREGENDGREKSSSHGQSIPRNKQVGTWQNEGADD